MKIRVVENFLKEISSSLFLEDILLVIIINLKIMIPQIYMYFIHIHTFCWWDPEEICNNIQVKD